METLIMTRPLDRLSAMTDYLISKNKEEQTKRRHYSETLGDYYQIKADGSLSFESGAEYTRAELVKVRTLSDETKRRIHTIKKIFIGAEIL